MAVSINDVLTDDDLAAVLSKLEREDDRDLFGLVCKRWLCLQSAGRRKLRARAGPEMLRRMAGRFGGVVELDLSQSASRSFYPGVTDSDLGVVVEGFGRLKGLELGSCKGVTDAGMLTLGSGLPSLQSLDVSFCRKLTDKGLIGIAQGCKNLRKLHLTQCKSITDELLRALASNCPHVEDLRFSGCINVTDAGLVFLANGCRRIKTLDVSKCSKIGDDGVVAIAEACSSLHSIKLLDCHQVGNKSILSLSNNCKNLETLVIGSCRNVCDESIKSLALSCSKSLRNLKIDWCLKVTDSALTCILLNCENLVALDIAGCGGITDVVFHVLGGASFGVGLKYLNANNCSGITVSGVGSILKFCRSMIYLDLRSCPHITKLGCDQAGLVFPKCCKVDFSGSLMEQSMLLDAFF